MLAKHDAKPGMPNVVVVTMLSMESEFGLAGIRPLLYSFDIFRIVRTSAGAAIVITNDINFEETALGKNFGTLSIS